MVKRTYIVSVILLLLLIAAGCARQPLSIDQLDSQSQEFKRYVPSREVMINLTETELIEVIGQPITKEKELTSEGKRSTNLTYLYVDSAAEHDERGEFAMRFATYIFLEGKYSYAVSSSTFKIDSTNFDIERAALIELGDSYAKVVELVGEPSGRSVDRDDDGYGSLYHYKLGTHPIDQATTESLVIFFDSDDVVTAVWSPDQTIPAKVPEEF